VKEKSNPRSCWNFEPLFSLKLAINPIDFLKIKTHNLTCLINCATKYLNAELKRDKYFVDEVETLIKRKTTTGQPNSKNPQFRRQS
jgi:hypothetical protein